MLLLAARLGIRSGDIFSLKLDDIDWPACCLKFTQNKTQRPLSLPLFQDVAEAIIDYLQTARPRVHIPRAISQRQGHLMVR